LESITLDHNQHFLCGSEVGCLELFQH
jgi:hypothetical protein